MALNIRTHRQNWLVTETISRSKLETGQLIGFLYSSDIKENMDKRPFVLFLGLDHNKNLLHGLALNYLTKYQLESLFKKMNNDSTSDSNKRGRLMDIDEEKKKGIEEVSLSKVFLGKESTPTRSVKTAEALYSRIVKPFIRSTQKPIYRSYKLNKIRNLRLVRYKWDIK